MQIVVHLFFCICSTYLHKGKYLWNATIKIFRTLFLAIIAYDLTTLFTLNFQLLRKSEVSKVVVMYIKCPGVVA